MAFFAFPQNINFISTLQIQSIIEKNKFDTFTVESEDIIKYMKLKSGICKIFEIPNGEIITRVAVLTIHQFELENMANFGDVLFIDGTHSNLKLIWEVFPITAITKDCNICCCGKMYAATANEEIILKKLILKPSFQVLLILMMNMKKLILMMNII